MIRIYGIRTKTAAKIPTTVDASKDAMSTITTIIVPINDMIPVIIAHKNAGNNDTKAAIKYS